MGDSHTAFLFSFFVAFFITPLIIRFANAFGLIDDPRKRYHPAHTHTSPVPRAGGLALYISIALSVFFFLSLTKKVIGILLSSALLIAIGLFDDKKDINPYVRLITNMCAAGIVIGAGIAIPYITNPLSGDILQLDTLRVSFSLFGPHSIVVFADIVAFLWIMWTMNIVGWSAGVDGQMPGFVAISAFMIGILSLRYSSVDPSQAYVTVLSFIVAGSFLGFLPWNFYPQKIMPGYGGKTLAGFLLGILGILSYAKFGTALLLLLVPSVDAIYTLGRRLAQKRSPVWADRGHLHHRLLEIGWGRRRIALFYWFLSAILGSIALLINSSQKIFTFLFSIILISGFILWVNYFTQLQRRQDPDSG